MTMPPLSRESIAVVGREALAERLGQSGQQTDRVCYDSDMSEIENRRVLVGVDRKDHVRAFDADPVLDRAGDAGGDVEFGPDRLAGLTDLAIGGDPALLHQRARAAIFRAKRHRQIAYELVVFSTLQSESAGDDDIGESEIGFRRFA